MPRRRAGSAPAVSGSGASGTKCAILGGTGAAESPEGRALAGSSIDHGSRCDLCHQNGTPARLGYYENYLIDNPSCVIVGVQATAADSQETVAAQDISLVSRNGRTNPRIGSGDRPRQRGVLALVGGSDRPDTRTRDSIHKRTARSTAPSGSLTSPNTIAISVLQAVPQLQCRNMRNAPTPTSGLANVAVGVR